MITCSKINIVNFVNVEIIIDDIFKDVHEMKNFMDIESNFVYVVVFGDCKLGSEILPVLNACYIDNIVARQIVDGIECNYQNTEIGLVKPGLFVVTGDFILKTFTIFESVRKVYSTLLYCKGKSIIKNNCICNDSILNNYLSNTANGIFKHCKVSTAVHVISQNIQLLQSCVKGLGCYKNVLTVFTDNNDVKRWCVENNIEVVVYDYQFNYAKLVNEFACLKSNYCDYAVLINDDVVTTEEIISTMVISAKENIYEIDVVGVKLLYSNNTIQHAGVRTDDKHGAIHLRRDLNCDDKIANSYSNPRAVTFALVVVNMKALLDIGMDENLRCDFNDIDFCLRCKGVLYIPIGNSIHYESRTRKLNGDVGDLKELIYFKKKHKGVL